MGFDCHHFITPFNEICTPGLRVSHYAIQGAERYSVEFNGDPDNSMAVFQ